MKQRRVSSSLSRTGASHSKPPQLLDKLEVTPTLTFVTPDVMLSKRPSAFATLLIAMWRVAPPHPMEICYLCSKIREHQVKTVIAKNRGKLIDLRELFHYRELLWMLAYRDYRVRYANTYLGFGWAVIQPLLTLIIFILVFNKAAKVQTGETPYAVFAMTGMWAWSYFAYVLTQAGQSVIGAQSLITKVYFPRIIIPVSKSIVGFIDFLISLLMLTTLMVYHRTAPAATFPFVLLFIFGIILFSNAVGIWFSALTIRFRDLTYVIPFIAQLGIYVSPVAYPSTLIPEQYKALYYLNPMAAIIDGVRWSLLGEPLPETRYLLYSAAITLVLLLSGIYYFRRVERVMADIL